MSDEETQDAPEESIDSSSPNEDVEFEIDADAIDDEVDEASIDRAMKDALDAVEQVHAREAEAQRRTQEDLEKGIAIVVETDELEEDVEVSALQAEIAELKDRSVRTLADFDNFRKRVERERDEARRYSSSDLLRELLGVVDNLERGMESAGSVEDLKEGLKMVLKQFKEVLRGSGVLPVEAEGERFDPAVHDAVSQVLSETADVPMVDSVLQSGYKLHDRLLRPAMVVVAMPEPEPTEESAGANSETPEPTDGGED